VTPPVREAAADIPARTRDMTDSATTVLTAEPAVEVIDLKAEGSGALVTAVSEAARLLAREPLGDACIAILESACRSAATDRAWMYEYNADQTRFRNTYEWRSTPHPTQVSELLEVPVTMIAWLHGHVSRGRAVAINDSRCLPPASRALQEELLRHGTLGSLCVPMMDGGRILGCIGFEETTQRRRWTPAEVARLACVGDLIAAVRFHQREQAGLASERGAWFKPLVYLRRQGGIRGVTLEQVLGLRSAHDYTDVWLADGSRVLDSRSLGLWQSLLPATDFQRIHRTAIVNLTQVADLDRGAGDRWRLRLRTVADPWPVSRAYRQELLRRLGL